MSVTRTLMLLPVVVAAFGSAAPAASAAWPADPNVNVPLCTAATDQVAPAITSDGAGGVIATWYDYRNGHANADIYAQRLNAAGVPQWTADGVPICTATNGQYSPTITADGAGGAIVTWEDDRNGDDGDIYAQRVNAAGVPQWTANGVTLCTIARDQLSPKIASDGAGGAIVSWVDHRSFTSVDIYAQRVNAAGVPLWTADGVALGATAYSLSTFTIVSDDAGGAIVAWMDYRSGTNYDIYTQRVNAAGVPQWTANGVAICAAANDQGTPTIISDAAGGAIVTWTDNRSGQTLDYTDIYAQRVNAAGVPQWTPDGVALSTAANAQLNPTITSDGASGAIVTWFDFPGNIGRVIYAQRVNAAGAPQWTVNGVALCAATGSRYDPVVVSDGAGGAIVTWEDHRNIAGDIFAQRVNAAGVLQWTPDGVAVCTVADGQVSPTIVSAGTGGAIVAWVDYRSGGASSLYQSGAADIYAQNVNADGTLGGTILSVPRPTIAAGFALGRVEPNPSVGDLHVSFSLLDGARAMLELYDLTGRRIESLSVGSMGPGMHVASVSPRVAALPPGVYCLSLTQGSHRAFRKVAIVR